MAGRGTEIGVQPKDDEQDLFGPTIRARRR